MKQIVITGCGRSGTKYIARVLERVNLEVLHERTGLDGHSDWHTASPLAPAEPRGPDRLTGAVVLHQVREPVAVISSARVFAESSWEFIYKNLPQIQGWMPRTYRCMAYWFYWNLLAESQAEWTYRVESLFEPATFNEFCRRTGIKPTQEQIINMQKVSTRKNSRDKRKQRTGIATPFTHEELRQEDESLFNRIMQQGKRYGYKGEI